MKWSSRPGLSLFLVRVASLLVPSDERGDWRREWHGELLGRWCEPREGDGGRAALRLDLAHRALGSFADAWRLRTRSWVLAGLGQDARVAARGLVRRPLFSGLVVSIIALGIGANATLFSVARDQLIRPFPYPDADHVVAIVSTRQGARDFSGNVTYPNMNDLAEASTAFSALGVIRHWTPALAGEAGAVVVRGGTVTANYFRILGVEAGKGRFFEPDEEGTGREPRVVLSHPFWQTRFGADPSVIGSSIELNGVLHEVIGVTAATFEDPWLLAGPGGEPQVWRTVASPPSEWPRSGRSWTGLGRLRPGVSLSAAQAELAALMAGLARSYPEANTDRSMRAIPLRDRVSGPVRTALFVLLGAVGLLLLVAATNLAGLFASRATERRREIEVRRALGASTRRLLRSGVFEAGLLAAMGGIVGVALTHGMVGLVGRLGASVLSRPLSGQLDSSVLAFAAGATLVATLIFGVLPMILVAGRGDRAPGSDGGRGATGGRAGSRVRRSLVVAQIALTTVLLVGSGLLVRSLERLGRVDLGLDTNGAVAVDLHGSAWWDQSEGAAQAQWDAVLDAVRSVPGVTSVGAMDYVPLGGSYSCDGVYREDRPPPEPGAGMCGEVRVILPGTLETLEVPLLRGRFFERTDAGDEERVAIVDQRMAQALWPGEDPIGNEVHVHTNAHRVVGIAENMQHFGPGQTTAPMIYLHAPQEGWNGIARGLTLILRIDTDGPTLEATRAAVSRVNPAIAFGQVNTLENLRVRTLAAPRFRALLVGLFGVSALALSLLGIAGIMSQSVARRTREMGVRLALGARPADVRGQVLGEGARLTAVGVLLGLGLAWVAGTALESVLFEVSARDPVTFAWVLIVVVSSALVSCYEPARRAARVDPISALSSE